MLLVCAESAAHFASVANVIVNLPFHSEAFLLRIWFVATPQCRNRSPRSQKHETL